MAVFRPLRDINSLKGSTTAAFSVFGLPCFNAGSATKMVIKIPGSINREVNVNTLLQAMWSAKMSDNEPGIKPAILYALTCTALPKPSSASINNSRL